MSAYKTPTQQGYDVLYHVLSVYLFIDYRAAVYTVPCIVHSGIPVQQQHSKQNVPCSVYVCTAVHVQYSCVGYTNNFFRVLYTIMVQQYTLLYSLYSTVYTKKIYRWVFTPAHSRGYTKVLYRRVCTVQ